MKINRMNKTRYKDKKRKPRKDNIFIIAEEK